jgi:hypothetical protein
MHQFMFQAKKKRDTVRTFKAQRGMRKHGHELLSINAN